VEFQPKTPVNAGILQCRRRKPRALDVIDGGRSKKKQRGERPLLVVTPLGELSSLTTDEERAVYRAMEARLLKSGVGLEEIHVFGLEQFAQYWCEILQYRKTLQKEGVAVKGRGGDTKKHPAVQALNDARRSFERLCVRYGLTPYDWERIDTNKTPGTQGDKTGETDDGIDGLLG